MCLYSHNTRPLVCDKDLVVYKRLKRLDDNSLVTPFQKFPVEYGGNIVAEGEMPSLPENYASHNITSGVIHSYIDMFEGRYDNWRYCYVKATIKAGTPFFVSIDGQEIASRELRICTEEENKGIDDETIAEELKKTRKAIYRVMREQCIGEGGVRVGDALLSDKTFVTPGKIKRKGDVIGVVGFIRDGKPYVISIKQGFARWMDNYLYVPAFVHDYKETVPDFNGVEHTAKLYKEYMNCLDKFPALEYCVKHKTEGTNEGDWYFPSSGEMAQAIRNSFVINVTLGKLGWRITDILSYEYYYWTSVETLKTEAVFCGAYSLLKSVAKTQYCQVRPLLNPNKIK